MSAAGDTTLLLSDVHLCEERPAQVERFLEVLAGPAQGCTRLLILGDLFEYWIGDDDCITPLAQRVVHGLAGLAGSAKEIGLLHGNRDFLLGARFAAEAGLQLMDDPVCIDLAGTPTILMHGDLLCTDDLAYLAFRRQVRDPAWQAGFLAQPAAVRHQQARGATAESGRAKQQKSMEIMDVTEAAVASVFRQFDADRLIHGHTHRPGHHAHLVDGRLRERWVLPDWYGPGGYLLVGGDGVHAVDFAA